ncbi:MAG: NAD synthetase [Candidatus Moranbacteria bacterium]|nr:NAD synthetase [Candidatus Moranbacteria bacterium]
MEILIKFIYLISAIFFIFGIKFLAKVKTARRGNRFAAFGMFLSVLATLIKMNFIEGSIGISTIIAGIVVGGFIGLIVSRTVKMTAMPELVAVFNGVGGGASVLVALSYVFSNQGQNFNLINSITVAFSVLIGVVTFSGSIIAFSKLKGLIKGEPILFTFSHFLNLVLLLGSVYFLYMGITGSLNGINDQAIQYFLIGGGIALVLGVLLVTPIGGADMPVVISLLNSYSGLAAAATGFVLGNLVLVVSGALVGASGIILTKIMCKAMNRSLTNVLFGGFGGPSEQESQEAGEYQGVKSTGAEEVAMMVDSADSIIIVPGYGLAVAQAQHAIRELVDELEKKGKKVQFAIHPVAGRMPGHMNVLLAEANIDYDKLKDLDQINSEFKNTDLVYVIGANDVVNPAAINDPKSPIFGMPILKVFEAATVINVKRSLSPGFANIKNPLFEQDNSLMFFEDAKKATEDIVKELREG